MNQAPGDDAETAGESAETGTSCSSRKRVRRGRPLRAWTADVWAAAMHRPKPDGINIRDVELMLYFISDTGASLITSSQADMIPCISQFWRHDIFQIGLSFPFLIHLIYALSARHMCLTDQSISTQKKTVLRDTANKHFAQGVSQMTKSLPFLDEVNGGALYLASMLVCICVLAAGPSGRHDLLMTMAYNQKDVPPGVPAICGMRYIMETVPREKLFADARIKPLHDAQQCYLYSDFRHSTLCAERGFSWIDWKPSLRSLQAAVELQNEQRPDRSGTRLRALDMLHSTSEGVYGGEDGILVVAPYHKVVFRWLYRVEAEFTDLVNQRDPASLLILAYWATLLAVVEQWYAETWPKHLLNTIRELLEGDEACMELLHWPSLHGCNQQANHYTGATSTAGPTITTG